MAALRPAGPPPTMHTSTWSVSLSTDLGSKEPSGVVAKRNRVAFEKARRSPAMRIAGLNVVRGKDRDVGLRTQEVMRSLLEGNESAERRMADDTGDREAITILRKAIDSKMQIKVRSEMLMTVPQAIQHVPAHRKSFGLRIPAWLLG
jgi:hypothetical protein